MNYRVSLSQAFLIAAIFCTFSVAYAAQGPANASPAPDPPGASPAPSSILQTSLDSVQHAVSTLKMDKWRRGTVRDEAAQHVSEILRDLQVTLPPVLKEADASPGTVSKVLPVSRNINLLYDVLLRVSEASRVSAPSDQVTQLEQALVNLGNARRALDEHMQESAVTAEKQVGDLRISMLKQAAARCAVAPAPVTPACATTIPARKPRKKPAAPATTTPQKTPPATTPQKTPSGTTPKPSN